MMSNFHTSIRKEITDFQGQLTRVPFLESQLRDSRQEQETKLQQFQTHINTQSQDLVTIRAACRQAVTGLEEEMAALRTATSQSITMIQDQTTKFILERAEEAARRATEMAKLKEGVKKLSAQWKRSTSKDSSSSKTEPQPVTPSNFETRLNQVESHTQSLYNSTQAEFSQLKKEMSDLNGLWQDVEYPTEEQFQTELQIMRDKINSDITDLKKVLGPFIHSQHYQPTNTTIKSEKSAETPEKFLVTPKCKQAAPRSLI